MGQSISRVAALITAIGGGLMLAACGATGTGPVIGVPPSGNLTVNSVAVDGALASFQQALTNELKQADLTQSANETAGIIADLNALANDPSLITAERLDALRGLGEQAAAKRLNVVNALIGAVSSNAYLDGVSVAGQSLRPLLVSRLNAVVGRITALQTSIAGAGLVDQLRSDVVAMAQLRVYGFVEPVTHLLTAAGDVIHEANALAATNQDVTGQIAAVVTDPNYGQEISLAGRLQSTLASIVSTATSVVQQVEGMDASGFPGNKPALANQRIALSQLSGSNGALAGAASIMDQIRYLLGQR